VTQPEALLKRLSKGLSKMAAQELTKVLQASGQGSDSGANP
jgi:hypothetical protein